MSEKNKKPKNKLILPIVIIAVVLVAIALIGMNVIPVTLPTTAGGTSAGTPNAPAANEFTTTGVVSASNTVTQTLPYYEGMDLEAGRYSIEVISDKPVWVMLYQDIHFEEWQDGKYLTMKAGTGCCALDAKVESFSSNFDVSKNEAGEFYIVVEGDGQATVEFRITQIMKFD